MATATLQGPSWSVWFGRGLAIALLGLACAGAFWIGRVSHEKPPGPVLVVAHAALNFGEVWEDAAFAWQLPLENRGSSDLQVLELMSSCGCLAIEPRSLEVPAGQTRSVHLKLDLRRDLGDSSGGPRGFSVRIGARVQGADGSRPPPFVWVVHGRVRPILTIDRRIVGFGESLIQGQPFGSRSVKVTAHTRLQRLDLLCEPNLVAAQLSVPPNDGSKYELVLRPKQSLPVGPFQCTVFLQPRSEVGSLPRVPILVEGRVTEDIQATPALVQFGVCRVGQTVRDTVVLQSRSGIPFEVKRVECGAADARVEVVHAEPAAKEYRIHQRAARRENQSGTIRFHVQANGRPALVVSVQVNYLGVSK